MTVPAIANASLSPKPDLFAGWVLLLACLDALAFSREGRTSAAFWVIAAFALAFASKLSAPPFIVAILAGMLGVWLYNRRPRLAEPVSERRFAIAITGAAIVVAALVTARTWILTGVPLIGPEQLVDLFAKWGMTLKPPAGFLSGGPPPDLHDLPALLTDQLFRPQHLAHMVISWIGNVWLYLFALALAASLLAGKPASDRPRVPLIWSIVLLTGLSLLAVYRNIERGGDGNYFVLPIALAILVGGYAALKRLPAGMPTRLLLATLPLFVVAQASYSFISAGWASGTRPFDFDLGRNVRDLRADNARVFRAAGIEGIAEYLRAVPGIARGVGYVADAPAFRLDATFETLNFYEYWRTEPLVSADAFIAYLAEHRIDYLIMPKPGKKVLKRALAAGDSGRSGAAARDARGASRRGLQLRALRSRRAARRCARRALSTHVAGRATLARHAAKPLRETKRDAAALDPAEIDQRRDDEPERQRRAEQAIAARERHEQQYADADHEPCDQKTDRGLRASSAAR